MKSSLTLLMTALALSGAASHASQPGLTVTAEDEARISALGMEPAKAALVRGFVSEIRTQSAKAGLAPTSFLEPMPTGENDEDYSKYRLNRMKMKRIAEQAKVESWAQKNHVEAKPGAVSYRRIGRNEAMARIAAVFEPDPLKQGELYSKLARTSQVSDSNLMLQSQRLGVSGQQVLAQLNNSEQQAENIEYTTVQEVFGVKKVKTKKKKSKKAVQAQRRAQAEAERRNQREEERILRKQKQLMAREEAKRKREALIAEREAKKARLREERHATPFSRGNSQIDGPQTAPSAPNPEVSKPAPAPQDLVSKDEEASLKLQEIFRKTEDWEIKRNDVWKPDSIKSPKPAANDAKSEAEPEDIFDKIKKIVPLSSRSNRKFPFYLALIERIIPKAHAEEFPDSPAPGIKENVSSSSGLSSDMEIFRLQSEQFHKLKETVETIDLKQRAEEILNDSTLRKAAESIAVREKKPVEAKETVSENAALPDEQTRWLTTFFISESMGEDNIKALFEAYAGDNTVRFVLKGFNGKGTINDGLKWLLSLAMAFEPQPNILIDPELYERFSVSVVPTMLLERIDGVPVEQQSAMEKNIGKTLSNLGYALGLTKDKSQSLADRLVSQNGAVSALKRSPALIVSGVTSRQWAVEKARTGADSRQGVQGEVFDIVERDIKEIAKERLAKIDWERKKEEALNRFWTQQEKNFIDLPLVEHESERTVDPTITLSRNIYGEDGTVIFKEGQRFNPFDAMPFTHTVVVFNAAQPKQLEAVEQIVREAREKNTPVMLLATEFKSSKALEQIQDLNRNWKESVFLLTPELKERFQIRATPTVVRADNERKVFYVREIPAL